MALVIPANRGTWRTYEASLKHALLRDKTMTLLTDPFEEEQFIAGEYVASGTYQQIGTTIRFRFDKAGYLPLPADGTMCAYVRAADLEAIAARAIKFGDNVRPAHAA
jgi:hypothetical protein